MPLNFYSFLIGSTLAEREFEAQGVPNRDRARQLGLIASLFSPGTGGGLGSSVVPAIITQTTARNEATAAAAARPGSSLTGSPGGTGGTGTGGTGTGGTGTGGTGTGGTGTGGTGTGGTGTGGGDTAVTRDEVQALTARVTAVEGLFADYHDASGKTFAEAKVLLSDFHVLTTADFTGEPFDETKLTVKSQFPAFREGMRLLRGSVVGIRDDPPQPDTSQGAPDWGEKG